MFTQCRQYYVSLLGFCLLTLQAQADSRMDELFNMDLEDLMKIKITSSTLTEESLLSVPASMTVFTREQILQLGVNTLEELMNHVPGYQSYRTDQTSAAYSSRSRRMSALNREILVLLDGQRLNHDVFGNASDIETNFSLHNVARVEFLRGPGSALYGANAFLGVVNIITATNLNESSISRGNNQQQNIAFNISHTFDNGLQTSLSAQGDSNAGDNLTLYDPVSTSITKSSQETNNRSIYWRAHWSDWALQVRHIEQRTEDGYVSGGVDDDTNDFTTRSSILALNYQHHFNEHWSFDSRLYDTPYSIDGHWRVSANPILIKATAPTNGKETGIENRLSWHDGSANALIGFDYSRNVIDDAQLSLWLPPAPPLPAQQAIGLGDRKVTGTYIQWQDALSEDLTYILGARNDHYSDVDGHTSPRLGLLWKLDDINTLKWLYGEAFRAPARNELSINIPQLVGNPSLKPEVSKTVEMVWIQQHQHSFTSISLFDTKIEDAVIVTNTTPTKSYANSSQQHLSGLEMEWQLFINSDWQLRSDLSHIFNSPFANNADAEDLLGSSLIYDNHHLSLSVSGRYHGVSRDINNSANGFHEWGGYTLFDAHAHYQVTPEWQIYGNLRNLADKDYTQPALQNGNNFYGVPSLGREVEIGIRWTY